MAVITLHQFPGDVGVESASPFCAKIHRLLGFKGLEYEPKNVVNPTALRRLNPGILKVPVLSYEGELIVDSTRIFKAIDKKHPDPPLWPADPEAAAFSQLLEDWADESLYWFAVYQRWAIDANFEPFARRAFGKLPVPVRWVVPKVARQTATRQLHGQGLGRLSPKQVLFELRRNLTMIEAFLEKRPFLATDQLTGGDIAVFAPLKAMSVREASPEAAALIRRRDSIMDWLRRVDEATKSAHTVPVDG